MSLNARSVATFGVGFGALAVASFGLLEKAKKEEARIDAAVYFPTLRKVARSRKQREREWLATL